MSGVSLRVFSDSKQEGQFTYDVDVLDSVRVVEEGKVVRTIDGVDLVLVLGAETDDDSPYRVEVWNRLGELEYGDRKYELPADFDGTGIIRDGARIWVQPEKDVFGAYGLYDEAHNNITLDGSGAYDGHYCFLRRVCVSSRLCMAVPVVSGLRVGVNVLNCNGHSVHILFCRKV